MDLESVLILLGLLFVITFIILYIWSIIWSFKDASRRGKNGFAVAVLVAFFAWPFGLLFWTIIRPESIKTQDKPSVTKEASEPNKYVRDFKEMPFLLKILLILSLYSLATTFFDFVNMKPIAFEYFNSGFPKNFPLAWYLYLLLFNIFTIVVYFKRSYSVLKKYLYITLGVLVVAIFNSIYSVINLPVEQRMMVAIVYAFTYVFGGLIFVYLLKQKKYFNRT